MKVRFLLISAQTALCDRNVYMARRFLIEAAAQALIDPKVPETVCGAIARAMNATNASQVRP